MTGLMSYDWLNAARGSTGGLQGVHRGPEGVQRRSRASVIGGMTRLMFCDYVDAARGSTGGTQGPRGCPEKVQSLSDWWND
jgi:hypothetical protein